MDYTNRWKGFQFRSPTYIDGRMPDPTVFDLVKWEEHEPYGVYNTLTCKNEISTESCFSIAQLRWNPYDEDFKFESVGLRYLEYATDELNEWVIAFANFKAIELKENYYD